VPVLLAASDEPVTLAISLAIVAVAVGGFAFAMWPLHRQMTGAREHYLQMARRLYEEAYAPIRENPSVRTLDNQSAALRVAQSLEERAHNLVTWLINETTFRFITVVISGVVTSLVVRGLFAALGL
jgi:hypothetical protein